jgi:hypothetical protein
LRKKDFMDVQQLDYHELGFGGDSASERCLGFDEK